MVKISDWLCYVVKLAGMICKSDRLLGNLQIVQFNLHFEDVG